MKKISVLLCLSSCLALLNASVWAFSEDICYAYKKPQSSEQALIPIAFNCNDLQCSDGVDADNSGASCSISGLVTLVAADMLYKLHGRNSLHFDVIWLLARAMGMNIEDSNTLAASSQATDLGRYNHYDFKGKYLWSSQQLTGVQRTNKQTNGFWLHFVPWYRNSDDDSIQHSLSYNKDSQNSPFEDWEKPLRHVRDWAFGKRKTLCSFAITRDDGSCYSESEAAQLDFYLTIFGPVAIDETTAISGQKIAPCSDTNDENCYQSDYDQTISGKIEALGIYLHMLGDRLSHFICSDFSAIEAVNLDAEPAQYQLNYALSCGTGTHLAMHVRETGHQPVPQRTQDSILYSLYEIDAWLEQTAYQRESGYIRDPDKQQQLLQQIISQALPETCAARRLQKLCEISQAYQLGWHDNNSQCIYQEFNCSE